MEKASAACAMDWSIELEKGLRSKRHGQHLKSIQLTGQRIEKWSKEPKFKLTGYNMFRMVHGEERLYADTILFRLADAFVSGEYDTKIHIVKVFLSEMKHQDGRRQGYGIFSKMSSANHVEILRRIKVALDDGNIESKALTLVLFGCLSEIANNFPEIRYEVLIGLQSPHPLEVKASFFAAGCFAEFSYDFASAFLEILIRIMTSPKTCSTVKVAAAWAFRKMGHFHSLTNKAHKAGSQIVLKYSEDDCLITLLISLSKLASKLVLLSSEQVSLLCSLLTHKISPHVQLMVLRNLRQILERTSHTTVGALLSKNLLTIFDDKQISSPLKCEALQLFITMILHVPYDVPFLKTQDFNKVVTFAVNVAKCPDSTNLERELATQALVGISKKLKSGKPFAGCEHNFPPLLSDVVSSIGDEAILQIKQISEYCKASDVELQFKSLLQLLFILIDSSPEVSLLVLDKLCLIFEYLVNKCSQNTNATEIASEVHKVITVKGNDRSFLASKITNYVYKCLFGFVQKLYAAEAISDKLLYKLKHLVSFLCHCNLFNCSTHVKFALLLHSCGNFSCILSDNGKEEEGRLLHGISVPDLLEEGILNSKCIGNMLAGNDAWGSYLVGKDAACQGTWFVCKFVFRHLKASIRSDIFSCWLSCLDQYSHLENGLQEMFSHKSGVSSLDKLATPSQLDGFQQHILTSDSIKMLTSACDGFLSFERLLGQTALLKQTFCFQRWFLALRSKTLGIIVDLLKLIATILGNQEVNGTDCSRLSEGDSIMQLLVGLSVKSQKIAREYDLMNSSFIEMDRESFRVISSIALSCSLLALCVGLAYLTPNSPLPENCFTSKDSGDSLHVTLVKDVVGRISHIDPETSVNIISILKGDDAHKYPLRPHYKSRSFNIVYEEGKSVTVCRAAVQRIRSMQNDTVGGTQTECSLPLALSKRRHFLLDIAQEWLSIPFRTPKLFFQVRPCVGAVLHSCSLDTGNPTDISVMLGSHLSLNMCLQLKNMQPDTPSTVIKAFCILHCNESSVRPHTNTDHVDYQSWTTDSMLSLQEKLQRHVVTGHENDGLRGETCVHFEMNGGVQGFTTCLIDVSAFPVGLYKIDWHSGCIDNRGSYWSLLPLSPSLFFTVKSSNS